MAPGRLRAREIETGTGRVRCLIPILLFGGFGYAHLRLFSLCSARPSVSIACSTSRKPPSGLAEDSYPPYNIERLAEDRYQITLAVAGFSPDEISVTAEQNVVTIEGGKTEKTEREFLYRGISTRALQAAVQPGRLRPGQGRDLRQRPAEDRTGPGNSRGHEAAADRHQRRVADNLHQLESKAA